MDILPQIDNINSFILNDVILPTMLLDKSFNMNEIEYSILSNAVTKGRLFMFWPTGHFDEELQLCPIILKDNPIITYELSRIPFMCLALLIRVVKDTHKNIATFYFLGLKRIKVKVETLNLIVDCKFLLERYSKDVIEIGDYSRLANDLRLKFFNLIKKAEINLEIFAFTNLFTSFVWLSDFIVTLLPTSLDFKIEHFNCQEFIGRIELANSAISSFNFDKDISYVRLKLQKLNDNLDLFFKSFNFLQTNTRFSKSVLLTNNFSIRNDDLITLEARINTLNAPKNVIEILKKEFSNLSRMSSFGSDYSINRAHLDYVVSLPWNQSSCERFDLEKLQKNMDKEHFGLNEVKKRIVEYFVIMQMKQNSKGPILCFVGPAGVGKTSMAYSIAKSLGRKFYKISLSGVSDASFLKGHRKTYVGSMPGQIMTALKTTGVNDPVILLDEIDKMFTNGSKDSNAALLEVFDQQQNETFLDHYVNIPFDLSKVLFIATANNLAQVSSFILDRVELLQMKKYSVEEKLQIAKNYLIDKRLNECGMSNIDYIEFTSEALKEIIVYYTFESGVRELSRKIDSICRHIAVKLYEQSSIRQSFTDMTPKEKIIVDIEFVEKNFGSRIYYFNKLERVNMAGVCIGLACNSVTGVPIVVEATKSIGKGQLQLTGNLGNSIQESAKLAFSWLKANYYALGINYENNISNHDVHIHFPSGIVRKDGPSAGIAITLAIVSLFTDQIIEPSLALSGEMTLRGLILPVGGIRDKVIAASRAGIRSIIFPNKNKNDVDKISSNVKDSITFHYVTTFEQVLSIAFNGRVISKFPKLITVNEKSKL